MSQNKFRMGDGLPSTEKKLKTRQAFTHTFTQETDRAILEHLHRIIYDLEKRVDELEAGN